MKFIIALFFGATFFLHASATDNPPHSLVRSFESSYPDAQQVSWSSTTQFHVASFFIDSNRYTAFYAYDGSLVVVARHLTIADLPKALAKDLTTKYQGTAVIAIYRMEAEDGTRYYAELEQEGRKILSHSIGKSWQQISTDTK